jgi:Holliday junction resolvasome RuvABC endonuclease subunit
MLLRRSISDKPLAAGVPSHRILGIDPSLGSTGYAYRKDGKIVSGRITTDALRGAHRLFYIRLQLAKVVQLVAPTLTVLEDYAMGAGGRNNNNVFNIGELGGVVKTYLWENGMDVLSVAPTQMKSVIALNGRADKTDISRALAQRFGIVVSQHDEADAVGLMLVGEMRCGLQTDALPRTKGRAQSDRFESIRQATISLGKGNGRLNLIAKPAQ